MKVLVTGAHGKVGRALVPALLRRGYDVRATDLTRPQWDRVLDERQARDYRQVYLTDAGSCYELAEASTLALEAQLPGHEVVYVASPDTIGGHPLEEMVRTYHGAADVELRPLPRPDASAIDSSKARRLLGWEPKRSWRDYLDGEGRLRAGVTAPW